MRGSQQGLTDGGKGGRQLLLPPPPSSLLERERGFKGDLRVTNITHMRRKSVSPSAEHLSARLLTSS